MTRTSLLSVKNLNVTFGRDGDAVPAVRGVSFSVEKGETLALVGESGSGKSVTALSILRLLPSATTQGEILFAGCPVTEKNARSLRGNKIAMVFQEPMTSLNPLHTIEKQVSEVLFVHKRMDARAARQRTLELLALVGLQEPEKRLAAYPHELSGGQRQRVMIAMALANEPDILIADEPTTALDVTVQEQILSLLKELQKKFGMALILITHDLTLVRRIATRVCVMQSGKIVEQSAVRGLFSVPRHPYTKMLLASEPKGCAEPVAENAPLVLSADDIKVHFPIKTGVFGRVRAFVRAVDGVSLRVREGETLGIVGESGSGKTTLGLALLRLLEAQGEVFFGTKNISGLDRKAMRPLRREMQIVFQDPYGSLSLRMTVGDIVAEGLDIHGLAHTKKERAERVDAALLEVGLDPASKNRFPHEFSGGQRQRVAIARAMILRPKLVILDEPTSALDLSVQAQIIALLRALQKERGVAYIFISHDLRVVRALASRVLVMKDGRMVEEGPTENLFSAPKTDYAKALFSAAFT